MRDIQPIIGKIAGLKPIPQVVHKVMALLEDPGSGMEELSRVVSHDPILTANLLRAVNSAYYGRPGKFESVHQAIVFLGMAEVADIVVMTSSAATLNQPQKGYDLEGGGLWRYSLSSALLSRALAEKRGMEEKHLIFTAALLKDIGKVVLSQYVSESFEAIKGRVALGTHSFREAEKEVIGIDHAELGAMAAEAWKFGPRLVDMIRHHHSPLESELAGEAACVVYMGDILCMMTGIGVGADGLAYRFQREVVERLALTAEDLQIVIAEFGQRVAAMEGMLAV